LVPSILCTLGPSSLNRKVIERLDQCGVSAFRINLSHTALGDLEPAISLIRQYTAKPICIDTEGAQVRTGPMEAGVLVRENQSLRLSAQLAIGNRQQFSLTPVEAVRALRVGDMVSVDFDSVLLRAVACREDEVEAIVVVGGRVGSNKAVTFYPHAKLPPLSRKDIAAIEVARRMGVREYALSFANSADDVRRLRDRAGAAAKIIAKIESQDGVRNLTEILEVADAILIDRGDLSREVPLENLPLLQKLIIRKANSFGIPVYVATNLLESMVTQRKPTRAEVNDIANTLLDGAAGLVLAAETAIGEHPISAAEMIVRIRDTYLQSLDGFHVDNLLKSSNTLLPRPHGSDLPAASESSEQRRAWLAKMIHHLPTLRIARAAVVEIEQLGQRVLAPLTGPMGAAEIDSVIDRGQLLSGKSWVNPVFLQATREEAQAIPIGATVCLCLRDTAEPVAALHVVEKSVVDLENLACRWFGTADDEHPGVRELIAAGEVIVAGPIEWLTTANPRRSAFLLSPAQARMIFDFKGWSKVLGVNLARAPRAGDEHTLAAALSDRGADGLLVNLVVSTTEFADDAADALVPAWQELLETRLPQSVLNVFFHRPRYCPWREEVHLALCLKNFGCTHYIAGPLSADDHSPGAVDAASAALADNVLVNSSDFGIVPVFTHGGVNSHASSPT